MKQELVVLCDNDSETMERRRYKRRGSVDGEQIFYVCPTCNRHFGIGHGQGYFDVVQQEFHQKSDTSDRCYEECDSCGHAKAIVRVDEKPDWKCLHCLTIPSAQFA